MSIPERHKPRLLIGILALLLIGGLSLWLALHAQATQAIAPLRNERTESSKTNAQDPLGPVANRDRLSRRPANSNTQAGDSAQGLVCKVTIVDESGTPIEGVQVERLGLSFESTHRIRIRDKRELGSTDAGGTITFAPTPSQADEDMPFLHLYAPEYEEVLFPLEAAIQSDVVLLRQIAWKVGLSFSGLPPVHGSINAVPEDPRALTVTGRSWQICKSTRSESAYCLLRFAEATFDSETTQGTTEINGVVPGIGYTIRATGFGMDGALRGSTHAIAGDTVLVELTKQPSHIIQLSPAPSSSGVIFLSCNCGQHAPFKLSMDDSGLIVVDLRRLPPESLVLSGAGEDWEIQPGVCLDLSSGVEPLVGRKTIATTSEARSQAVVRLAGGWTDAAEVSVCIPLDTNGTFETVDWLSRKWTFRVLRIDDTIHWREVLAVPAKFFLYHKDRYAIPIWISTTGEEILLNKIPTQRVGLKAETATSVMKELGWPERLYWQQRLEWPNGDQIWVTVNSMRASETDKAVVLVVGAQYQLAADLEGKLAVPVDRQGVISVPE